MIAAANKIVSLLIDTNNMTTIQFEGKDRVYDQMNKWQMGEKSIYEEKKFGGAIYIPHASTICSY